jgi:hypothetical protein
MPLFFQTVFLDTASMSGLRLVVPSLATPLGGLTTGLLMRRDANLTIMTRFGLLSCTIGTALVIYLSDQDPRWMYSAALVFGNFGQGVVYPALLFTSIKAALTEGDPYTIYPRCYPRLTRNRFRGCHFPRVHVSLLGDSLGCCSGLNDGPESLAQSPEDCFGGTPWRRRGKFHDWNV